MDTFIIKCESMPQESIDAKNQEEAAILFVKKHEISEGTTISVKGEWEGMLSRPLRFESKNILKVIEIEEEKAREIEEQNKRNEILLQEKKLREEEAKQKKRKRETEELVGAVAIIKNHSSNGDQWIDLSKDERTKLDNLLEKVRRKDIEKWDDLEKEIFKSVPSFLGRKEFKAHQELQNPNTGNTNNHITITTETVFNDMKITERKGFVTAECAFGNFILKDMLIGLRNEFGGRSKTTQKAFRDARDTVLSELEGEAREKGANAIIGTSIDYTDIGATGSTMLLVVASGTAVNLAPAS